MAGGCPARGVRRVMLLACVLGSDRQRPSWAAHIAEMSHGRVSLFPSTGQAVVARQVTGRLGLLLRDLGPDRAQALAAQP